jgi:alanine-glyoxylate transaminase/serine-glyoxylate transaminase/serine-pyruvate transaminase
MFSHRWIDMCQRHGLDVEVVETPWGEGAPGDRFEEILRADTATHQGGPRHPQRDRDRRRSPTSPPCAPRHGRRANHPALLFVDGVSSIASMDSDSTMGRRHRRHRLAEGLHAARRHGHRRRQREGAGRDGDRRLPRCFFDIRDMRKSYANGGYPYTPPVGLMNGLRESLPDDVRRRARRRLRPPPPHRRMACARRGGLGPEAAPSAPSSTPTPSARSSCRRASTATRS